MSELQAERSPRPSLPAIQSGYERPYSDWIDVAAPGAGLTASFGIDGSSWRRIVAARATLTTDANVANRLVSLDYIDGRGTTRHKNSATVVQPASKTNVLYEWSRDRTSTDNVVDTLQALPLLEQWMPPGFVVKFNVTNIQAGDTLTGLSLWLERWDTGPEAGGIEVWDVQPAR